MPPLHRMRHDAVPSSCPSVTTLSPRLGIEQEDGKTGRERQGDGPYPLTASRLPVCLFNLSLDRREGVGNAWLEELRDPLREAAAAVEEARGALQPAVARRRIREPDGVAR